MTEPFQLSEGEELPRSADSWIERVRAADAEAEARWRAIEKDEYTLADMRMTLSLIAIAAELRAQRIARRPGLGKS